MADFTTYANGDVVANSGGYNAAGLPAVTVLHNTYDVARGNVTSGDTCTEFMKIPAGSFVLAAAIEVVTGEASVTAIVGTAADPDGFVAGPQSVAAAGRFAGAGALVSDFFDADTWVEFTIGGADLTTGVFRVSLVIANVG